MLCKCNSISFEIWNEILTITIMFILQAKKTLRTAWYKITKPRTQVLEFFDSHVQAASPYDIQKFNESLDIVSIYRTIEILETLGLIHKIRSLWWYVKCTFTEQNCQDHCCHEFQICSQCNTHQELHKHHHHTTHDQWFHTTQHISEKLGVCKNCT